MISSIEGCFIHFHSGHPQRDSRTLFDMSLPHRVFVTIYTTSSTPRDKRNMKPMEMRISWEYRCSSSSASALTNERKQHHSSMVCIGMPMHAHNVYLTDLHLHLKAIVRRTRSQQFGHGGNIRDASISMLSHFRKQT